jgi:hypothetical protein
LSHFQAVGEARAVVIALVIDENLGLVVEAAEGGRMEDAVAVAGVRRAGRTRRFLDQPPAASPLIDRIGGKRPLLRRGTDAGGCVKSPFSFAALAD